MPTYRRYGYMVHNGTVTATERKETHMTDNHGVWLVWDHDSRDTLHAIFPADQELQARRWADDERHGFAWIEFQPYTAQ